MIVADDTLLDGPAAAEVLEVVGRGLTLGLVVGRGSPDAPFAFRLAAQDTGIASADPRAFLMAAAAAGCHPNELVSVGGRLDGEVAAAQAVGARAVWVDRIGGGLPSGAAPDAVIADLAELPAVLARFEADDVQARGEVGVGPHPEPWPTDPRLDPALLAEGDRRNVVDGYRYWREDAIVADLDTRRHPVHVTIENWRHDRNIGAVVRNANAFNVAGVHIVGRRRWNRRGAMATDRYLTVHQHDTVDAFLAWAEAEGLAVVAVDNVPGSVPLESTDLPRSCVLVFGQEGPGVSAEVLDAADLTCAITQHGSTRSLNAGVASGIALHAWALAHARGPASKSDDPAR